MRRILLTTDVVGGVWDFCLTLGRELSRDTDVTLLGLGEPSAAQRVDAAAARLTLRCEPLKLEWMTGSAQDVERTRALVRDVVREVQADVVHANQFAAACADIEVPVVLTLHSDVLSWRRWTLGAEGVPHEWRPYVALVDEALTRADSVVAVSAFLASHVAELYTCARPIEVIHNGWNAPARRVPKEQFTLVAGRAWDAAKNVALAGEAAVGKVYLAGELGSPDGGRAEAPAGLDVLGHLSRAELDDWLARAMVYLSPARYDPFGLLPLQAALHGCALLLSDIPSYRELWDGAACFFRVDNVHDLRAKWRALLAGSDLGRAARKRATTYSVQRMARRYKSVYASARRGVPA
jgi:glycogen(starch) synthase